MDDGIEQHLAAGRHARAFDLVVPAFQDRVFRLAYSILKDRADTGGSQWFVTHTPQPHLDGKYTVFGKVVEGMDVVNAITRRDPQQTPVEPAVGDAIETITITEK